MLSMNICNGAIIDISNIDISNIDHRCISKIAQDFIFDCSNDRKNTPRAQISVTAGLGRVTRYSWKNLAPTGLSNVGGYPSETHLNLKPRKISLVNKIPFSFYTCFWYFAQTMSVSITAVQCTTFQNNWADIKWAIFGQTRLRMVWV